MEERIEKIKKKLIDKNIKVSDTVDISAIRAFEQKCGIILPKELVDFYTKVTNGCIMIDGFSLYRIEDWKYNLDKVSKEFPFERYYIWEDEDTNLDLSIIENGNIELIDIGDAQTWNIIVAGKDYGKMWFFTDVGVQSAAPARSFLDWFDYWIDGNDDYFNEFVM